MKRSKLLSLLVAIFTVALLAGCSKGDENNPVGDVRYYIMCQGTFPSGSGSVSAINRDGTVTGDMFSLTNNRPIGNVPQSMVEFGGNYYITVSGSGKIEVVATEDFSQRSTITKPSAAEFFSPYGICFVDDNTALVSDLSNSTVWILNPSTATITGGLSVGAPGHNMVVAGGKVFIGCSVWDVVEGRSINTLEVVEIADLADPANAEVRVIENATPPYEAEIYKDSAGKVWLVAEEGLVCVDPATESVLKTIPYGSASLSFSNRLHLKDDYLYVNLVDENYTTGIYKVSVNGTSLPASPMFELPENVSVYGMKISREGNVIVCDPLSYTESGYVYEYSPAGTQLNRFTVGVVPGTIYVK